MRLGIFIINYNGLEILKGMFTEFIRSFVNAAQYAEIDLWFVDNGSRDRSVDETLRISNRIKVIRLSRNLGYAAACNIALTCAERGGFNYDFYIFSNNDIYIYKNSITELIKWLEQLDEMLPGGFIGSPILINGFDGTLDICGTYVDPSGGTWPLSIVFKGAEVLKKALRNRPLPVSHADGAFLVISRNVIRKIGLFDSRFFMYHEDTDLGLRGWVNGIPSLLIPVILGSHYRSSTAGKFDIKYYALRNRIYIAARYFGTKGLLLALAYYALYPLRAADSYLIRRRMQRADFTRRQWMKAAKTIFRAAIDAIRMIRTSRKEEHVIFPTKTPLLKIGILSFSSTKALIRRIEEDLLKKLLQKNARTLVPYNE